MNAEERSNLRLKLLVVGFIFGALVGLTALGADEMSPGTAWASVLVSLGVAGLLGWAGPRWVGSLLAFSWPGIVLGGLVALFLSPVVGLAYLGLAAGVFAVLRLVSWRIDVLDAPKLHAFVEELERVKREAWNGLTPEEREEFRAQGKGL